MNARKGTTVGWLAMGSGRSWALPVVYGLRGRLLERELAESLAAARFRVGEFLAVLSDRGSDRFSDRGSGWPPSDRMSDVVPTHALEFGSFYALATAAV